MSLQPQAWLLISGVEDEMHLHLQGALALNHGLHMLFPNASVKLFFLSRHLIMGTRAANIPEHLPTARCNARHPVYCRFLSPPKSLMRQVPLYVTLMDQESEDY